MKHRTVRKSDQTCVIQCRKYYLGFLPYWEDTGWTHSEMLVAHKIEKILENH